MKNLEQKIPLHIRIMSMFYPVINYQKKYGKNEQTVNLAKGEIEKLNIVKMHNRRKKIGEKFERLTWDDKRTEYDTTWVHLGQDYFKQISKMYSRSC